MQSSQAAAYSGLAVLAPVLRDRYQLSLTQIGVLLGVSSAGAVLTLLPWGLGADRIGERATATIGLLGATAGLAAAAYAPGFESLVVLLSVASAFGASTNTATGRAVTSWFRREERGLALGIRQTAIPIGGAAAAATLPWLASTGGTRRAFFTLAAACLAGAAVAVTLMRDAPARPVVTAVGGRGPLRDAGMWLLAGGSSLYLLSQMAIASFVVLFLHDYRGVSAHRSAAVLAGINVIGIGTRIAAGRWSDRIGSRLRPLRLIGVFLAVAMALATALLDAPLGVLIPALVVAGVLGISWNGLSFTAAAESAGLARSGAALGFQQTLLGVVGAGFPPAFAAVVTASSWRTAFALCVLGPVLGLAALWRVPDPPTGTARRRGTSAMPPAAR